MSRGKVLNTKRTSKCSCGKSTTIKSKIWQIVESIQLNTMCATYNHQFAIYGKDKTKVTQLILSTIWKAIYAA
jgi:hypothetical protein